jgi:hypothetical protein
MPELWKPVLGLAKLYVVSNAGTVKCIGTHGRYAKPLGRIMKPHRKPNGYMAIDLYESGDRLRMYVHRVVWAAFNGEIPSGVEINHKNGVRDDNRLENLELVTRSENMLHGVRVLGRNSNPVRGHAHHKSKLTEDDVRAVWALAKAGKSQKAIAETFGVSQAAIGFILTGKNWKHVQP